MSDNNKDSSNDIMYALVAISLVLCAIYYFFGTQIIGAYLTLKLWELKFISAVWPSNSNLELIKIIENTPLKKWTLKEVFSIGGYVGKMANIPLLLILGYFTYKIWDKNPLQKYKRVFDMKTLKQSEQRLWPYIAPVVNLNLISEPFDKGPYAMAMKPYDFAVKHKLLDNEKDVTSINKTKSEKLFISQLDKLFAGFNKLKKHEQALFVVMAAHGCGDKAGAMAAIAAMAQSAAQNPKKMPDFSSVKPLLKYVDDARVQEICNKHAYVYTVMAQMIEFARTTGVFPPSYIIWLRPRDRTLWYVLNCVGRQVAFVEVAGIFGHWKAEKTANHKLEAGYVVKAVEGLEIALSEVKVT